MKQKTGNRFWILLPVFVLFTIGKFRLRTSKITPLGV